MRAKERILAIRLMEIAKKRPKLIENQEIVIEPRFVFKNNEADIDACKNIVISQ